ncbi:MAG: acyl carrier protein [Oscillospiraceae bacterium]|jgi:acyl carrier protein|nr:acyl carrier protein [Oscillospiraceae bacterium]
MIFEKVKEILCDQLDIEESKIKLESGLIDDLGADSLDLIDMVMSIEDEFGIEVPDSAIDNIKTVADAVKFIEDRQLQ